MRSAGPGGRGRADEAAFHGSSGGIAAGLLLSLAAGRWAGPLLFGPSPREPLVLGAVVATLPVATLLASVVPAWRASRVSPSAALREQ